jgi:predicted nucleic acid-binding protein
VKRLRIYIDTSVIGGCFDKEFAPWSNGLFTDFQRGTFQPVVSAVVAAEVVEAPEPVRAAYAELLVGGAEEIVVGTEALSLLQVYTHRRVLGLKYRNDMLHIATATVAGVDVLVSWNFKHIVRLDRIRLFNAISIEQGYQPLQIYSPREVTTYEHGID